VLNGLDDAKLSRVASTLHEFNLTFSGFKRLDNFECISQLHISLFGTERQLVDVVAARHVGFGFDVGLMIVGLKLIRRLLASQ
jgi:hypothetical protein